MSSTKHSRVSLVSAGLAAVLLIGPFTGACSAAPGGVNDRDVAAHAAFGAGMMHALEARRLEATDRRKALAEWKVATGLFGRALANDPRSAAVASKLAACHLRTGRFEDAVILAEKMLKIGAFDGEVVFQCANVCAQKEEYDRAIRLALLYLDQRKDLSDIKSTRVVDILSGVYELTKKFDEGLTTLEKLHARAPANPGILRAYVRLAERKGDRPLAITVAEAFTVANPDDLESRITLAGLYIRSNRRDLAVKPLVDAISADTVTPGGIARVAQAAVRLALQARDDAQCRRLVELLQLVRTKGGRVLKSSFLLEITLQLGDMHARLKAFPKAQALIGEIEKTVPDTADTQERLSQLFWTMGRRKEAIDRLEAYVVRTPAGGGTRKLRLRIAKYLELQGNVEAAIGTLKKNLAEAPEDANTCNHLGYLYAVRNIHLDDAVALLGIALKSEPESPTFQDSLGWAYYQVALRDNDVAALDKAAENLGKAAKIMGRDPVVANHVGDLYYVQGKLKDAVDRWKAVLAAPKTPDEEFDRARVQGKIKAVIAEIAGGTGVRPLHRPLKPPPVSLDK